MEETYLESLRSSMIFAWLPPASAAALAAAGRGQGGGAGASRRGYGVAGRTAAIVGRLVGDSASATLAPSARRFAVVAVVVGLGEVTTWARSTASFWVFR